jgi:hypothetical protein
MNKKTKVKDLNIKILHLSCSENTKKQYNHNLNSIKKKYGEFVLYRIIKIKRTMIKDSVNIKTQRVWLHLLLKFYVKVFGEDSKYRRVQNHCRYLYKINNYNNNNIYISKREQYNNVKDKYNKNYDVLFNNIDDITIYLLLNFNILLIEYPDLKFDIKNKVIKLKNRTINIDSHKKFIHNIIYLNIGDEQELYDETNKKYFNKYISKIFRSKLSMKTNYSMIKKYKLTFYD